jgi:nucleotide-binding universal stress UspA family protein
MISLSKILLPVDFSDRSVGATRYAIPLARHFNSELTLLHVITPQRDYGSSRGAVTLADSLEQFRAESKEKLDAFMRPELKDLRVDRVLLQGDPAPEIVGYAHSGKFDLIMMATHGYGPFRRFLLGSVTAKVLHDAVCPVWTGVHVENFSCVDSDRASHIVCAIDLDCQSKQTLEWAAGLSSEMKAQLTIVHVVKSLVPHTLSFDLSPEWRKHVSDEALAALEKLKQDLGIRAEVKLGMGDVHEGVCLAATDLKADLVVINRGTDGGFGGRLRTNAYAIIRESPCPVVSI